MATRFDQRDQRDPLEVAVSRVPMKSIALGALALFVAVTAYSGYYKTHAGFEDIVIRFGAAVRTSEPGPHWKIPYLESVHPVEIRERAYVVKLEAASRDPMELPIEVTLNWQVNKKHVVEMFNNYGELSQFEDRIIKPRLPDAVKGVISTFAVNDLLTKRTELRTFSREAIAKVIPQDIMTITGFAVTNVGFPKAYTDQIARVQVQREAANEQQEVLRRQNFVAQEKTQSALADANAVKAKADGDAYATTTNATAEAAKIKLTGSSINDNLEREAKILSAASALVDFRRAQQWNGALPQHFWGGDASAATMFNMPGTGTKPTIAAK